MNSWYLQPIFNSYLLVAVAAGVMLGLLLLPTFRPLSTRRRWTLIGLRAAVILLILVAMLRPTLITSSSRPQSALLLLLLDKSRSMQLPAAAESGSRWDAQTQLLAEVQPLLKSIREDLELKIYAYDRELEALEMEGDQLKLPAQPDGEETDIGSVLYEAVRREHGKRLAAVFLLGDGAQTAFEPQVDVSAAGRELSRLGYPLYTVGFGPAADAAQSRDVAVEQLPEQYTVFVKNELRVRGMLRVRGYVNQDVPVHMDILQPDGTTRTLGPINLQARTDGEQVPIEMNFVPALPGQYKLTVRAAEQPGELVSKNNQLSAFVTALDGGLKVLYLEGAHRNEVRFLRRALDNSPDIQVAFDLVEPSSRGSWPIKLDDVWRDDAYDVFIIGDLAAAALGEKNLQQLAAAVQRGKGLMLLGGLHSYGPGGYRGTPLEDVLPIEIGRFELQDFDAAIREDLHLPGRMQLLPTRPHPVMFLAGRERNTAAWKRLPPLRGANKFAGVKESPGVQVIGQTAKQEPLLIASEFGKGRVLTSAVDSTWVWAMRGFDAEHRRFWRQSILWLVRRDDLTREDVWVKLSQRRFRLGSRVEFTTGVKSPLGETPPGVQLEAILQLPDKTQRAVRVSRRDEDFGGIIDQIDQAGDYLLIVSGRVDGRSLGTARADFQVLDEDIELSNPAADPDQLARLAGLTAEFGGKLLPPEQLAAVLREIKKRPPELEIQVQTKWQLGGQPLSAWLLFLSLGALLIGEWVLRKRWGLV